MLAQLTHVAAIERSGNEIKPLPSGALNAKIIGKAKSPRDVTAAVRSAAEAIWDLETGPVNERASPAKVLSGGQAV